MHVKSRSNPPVWRSWWLMALIAWAMLIFYLSHQPGSGPDLLLPWIPGEIKNLMHFPVFGMLALLCFLWLSRITTASIAALLALLFTLVYGISDEWHQSFVPARDASLSDVINDMAGAVTFLSIHFLAKHRGRWSAA